MSTFCQPFGWNHVFLNGKTKVVFFFPVNLPSLKLTFSHLKHWGWKMKNPFGKASWQVRTVSFGEWFVDFKLSYFLQFLTLKYLKYMSFKYEKD